MNYFISYKCDIFFYISQCRYAFLRNNKIIELEIKEGNFKLNFKRFSYQQMDFGGTLGK